MDFSQAEQHLSQVDSVMAKLIAKYRPLPDRFSRGSYFASLARSIVGQQVSTHSAAKVFTRLENQTKLNPELIMALTDEQVTEIGLSRQKRRYLMALAEHFVNEPEIFTHLEKLSDEEVISELTKVVGIGVWTAQMFLMFTLKRPDIFAPGDRGLQLAIERHYGLDSIVDKLAIGELTQRWSPYRSTASLYLWESLNNSPE